MTWCSRRSIPVVTLAVSVLLACSAEKTAAPPASSVPAAAPALVAPPPAYIAAPTPEPELQPEPVAAIPPEPAIADKELPEDPSPATDPERPRKVLILGDSLAATGFGALLERKLDAHPQVECFRKAKSATGLARPDFYDWETEARKQVETRSPDLVVVILGGNDGQDLTTRSGKGKRVPWKSDAWNDAYRTRISEFLKQIGAEERKVLWLGLPRSSLTSFEQKLKLIREVQSDAVAAIGATATYVDTTPFITDARGELLTTATVGKHKNQELRADDGIHFTMAGSEFLADKVYPEVLRVLEIEDAPPASKKKP